MTAPTLQTARVVWSGGDLVVHEPCGCVRRAGATTTQCLTHEIAVATRAGEARALGALMVRMERS